MFVLIVGRENSLIERRVWSKNERFWFLYCV